MRVRRSAIFAHHSLHDSAIIGQPDAAQSPALVLGIDDVHADGRKQALQFAIRPDTQQNAIKMASRPAEHARFVNRIGLCQCIERCGDQFSVHCRIIAQGCGLCRKCGHGAGHGEDFECFCKVEPPDGRRPVSAEIDHAARGQLLHRLAHGVAADPVLAGQAGFGQDLAGDQAPVFKIAHDTAKYAARGHFGVPSWG